MELKVTEAVRRQALDREKALGLDGALAVEGLAERIDDAADERRSDRHRPSEHLRAVDAPPRGLEVIGRLLTRQR